MIDRPAFAALADDLGWATERLEIRRVRSTDEPTLVEHELDRDIMAFICDPMTRDVAVAKVATFKEAWSAEEGAWIGLAVTERDGGELTGLVFFRVVSYDNESVEIGYRLHPRFQGRGYTTEACRGLLEILRDRARVHKVIALCVAENRPSWRVMEKLGLEREGLLRQHSKLGGEWCDELVYGLIFEPDAG